MPIVNLPGFEFCVITITIVCLLNAYPIRSFVLAFLVLKEKSLYSMVMIITNRARWGCSFNTGILYAHIHKRTRTHTRASTDDHSYNTEKCAHRISSLQDPAKQINKLLIKRGKCDWTLTGGAMIYCTCHHLLKVTLTPGR